MGERRSFADPPQPSLTPAHAEPAGETNKDLRPPNKPLRAARGRAPGTGRVLTARAGTEALRGSQGPSVKTSVRQPVRPHAASMIRPHFACIGLNENITRLSLRAYMQPQEPRDDMPVSCHLPAGGTALRPRFMCTFSFQVGPERTQNSEPHAARLQLRRTRVQRRRERGVAPGQSRGCCGRRVSPSRHPLLPGLRGPLNDIKMKYLIVLRFF